MDWVVNVDGVAVSGPVARRTTHRGFNVVAESRFSRSTGYELRCCNTPTAR